MVAQQWSCSCIQHNPCRFNFDKNVLKRFFPPLYNSESKFLFDTMMMRVVVFVNCLGVKHIYLNGHITM